ncbi:MULTISPECIES: pyruvate formate-lyase-activating protein [Miniimonas]|uniref:pyruvate formate-lyase-activating protein n=1 Tax=Miniimonas TaxID=947525 RepID=UPI000D528D2D
MTATTGTTTTTSTTAGAPTMLGGLSTVMDADRRELLAGMRTGEIGMVHSWELVTAVDGPGTRMTTFFSGCPLRCLYCHNPDTLQMRGGKPVRADDLLGRIKRYRNVFKATRGGITLSGGEVLMQPAFAARILRGAKAMGIHTALDTSGFLGANASDELLADVDLVLLDVKSGLPDTYKRTTGRELAPTLTFGRRLSALGIETWIRFVLVPGLTDADENIAPIVEYAASLESVSRVEVLPFHQMGRAKWEEIGMRYELGDTKPPTIERTEQVRDMFRAAGLTTY